MPGEIIDRPNPQALPSLIPDDVLQLSVKLEKIQLSDADLKGLEEFRRASNYIAAGQSHLLCRNIFSSSRIDLEFRY